MKATSVLVMPLVFLLQGTSAAQDVSRDPMVARNTETVISALPWLSLKSLNATRNRPLFAQDRRPVAPPPPPPTAQIQVPSAPVKQLPTLRGIIVQPTTTLVLLEERGSLEAVVVRSGDNFGSWKVTVESSHSVQLASGSERISLDLFED